MLTLTSELLEKYKGKLQAHYEEPAHKVVAVLFRGLAGKRVVTPSKDFARYVIIKPLVAYIPDHVESDVLTGHSHHNQAGVKCSIKANEGHLYCLDKSFMFVPKPATYISFDNIAVIVMSRVGGAVSASRTFDITITMKGGSGEHQFSNINRLVAFYNLVNYPLLILLREEQKSLEDFFEIKGLKTKNEMTEDVSSNSTLIQRQMLTCYSRVLLLRQHSRMLTWRPRMRKLLLLAQSVVQPTKMRRALTKTSEPTQNQTSPKSTTLRMRAAVAVRTKKWQMPTAKKSRRQLFVLKSVPKRR